MTIPIVEANGARIPAIGLGTWDLRGRTCARMVEQALRLGYRHVDTAEMYDNEREVGEGLRACGIARRDVFITTKVWQDHLAPREFERATKESLARPAPFRARPPADPLAQPAHSARRHHRRAVPDEAGRPHPPYRNFELHRGPRGAGGKARHRAAGDQSDRMASLYRPVEGGRSVPPPRPVR